MNIGCPVPSTSVVRPGYPSVHGSLLDIPYTPGVRCALPLVGNPLLGHTGNYPRSRSIVSPAVISTFSALESHNILGWLVCPVIAFGTPQN
jgi:hypothetical protein